MIPVDMRGANCDADTQEEMLDRLGARGAAEAFASAKVFSDQAFAASSEADRPREMTVGEWALIIGGGDSDSDQPGTRPDGSSDADSPTPPASGA